MSLAPPEWSVPEHAGLPGSGEVHVWRARLNAPPDALEALLALLSRDEQARAARLRHVSKHAEFVQARAILRTILGRYLNRPPQELVFAYTAAGKPLLAEEDAPLHFNLAHSHGWLVLGLSAAHELGVDIEHIARERAHLTLARRYFSPQEARALHAMEALALPEAFYRCWTCKEAWLKARGVGLHYPLNGFTIALEAGAAASLVSARDPDEDCAQWRLQNFAVDREHIAACAVRADEVRWRFLHFSQSILG